MSEQGAGGEWERVNQVINQFDPTLTLNPCLRPETLTSNVNPAPRRAAHFLKTPIHCSFSHVWAQMIARRPRLDRSGGHLSR